MRGLLPLKLPELFLNEVLFLNYKYLQNKYDLQFWNDQNCGYFNNYNETHQKPTH